MSLQLSTVLFKLDNSVTSSFNFRPIVLFVLVISLRSLSSISSRCLFTYSRTLLITSIGHIKTTETIPHSLIDQEEKKKVNFQTGNIEVLFTIDLGTVQAGT
jgi:hypothetical protein